MNNTIFELKAREYGISPLPSDATVAMAYVPYQTDALFDIYSPEKGICAGTMFPDLDKPFVPCKCGGGLK